MDKQNNDVLKSKISPIILRIPQIDDAKELLNILTDIRNTEYDPHINKGLTLDNINSMVTRMRKSATLDNPNSFNFVIIDTSINKVIGLSGFGHIDINNRIGDVGVIINFDFRGKGYATEAIKMSINYGFNNLKLNEVTATMLEKNIPMRNLLDKRLKLKGIKRKSEFGDEYFYSVKSDF